MTGSDIDSDFELLWSYASGCLPVSEHDEAIRCALRGLATLADEIKAHQEGAVHKYVDLRASKLTHKTCASCGMRGSLHDFDFESFSLKDELSLFKFTPLVDDVLRQRILTAGRSGCVFSFYQDPNSTDMWHLHREFVDIPVDAPTSPSALLCFSCAGFVDAWNKSQRKKRKQGCSRAPVAVDSMRPPLSISGGKDFGDLRRHPDFLTYFSGFTEIDWMAIAPGRMYGILLKVSGANAGSGKQRSLRGHLIGFRQNSIAEVAKLSFPNMELHTMVSLTFVGPRKQYEKVMKAALPFGSFLTVDHDKFEKLLRAMQVLKDLGFAAYADVPDFEDVSNAAQFEAGRHYFNKDRTQAGSFLNKVYQTVRNEADELVCKVDVVANNSDPAKAQQQAAEHHGVGDPDIDDDHEVIYERIFVDDPSEVGRKTSSGDDDEDMRSKTFTAALDLFVPPEAQQSSRPKNGPTLIPRESTPLNEFTENNDLFCSIVPQLFPLGKGPSKKNGPLTGKERRHLLLQYNPLVGNHPFIVPLLFDQLQRIGFTGNLAAAVRNNSASFNDYQTMIADPSTVPALRRAVINPRSDEARKLLLKLNKIMVVVDALVPNSAAARKSKLGDYIANNRFFGFGTLFLTRSPDPIGDPNTMRLTIPTFNNRDEFPNVDGGFVSALRAGEHVFEYKEHRISLRHKDLMQRANNHPATHSENYRLDVDAVFDPLMGMPLSHCKKTTVLPESAAAGKTLAAQGCHEATGKGNNHMHSNSVSGEFCLDELYIMYCIILVQQGR